MHDDLRDRVRAAAGRNSAPTAEGPHRVAIYRDGNPASRLVVLIDGPRHVYQAR